MEGQMILKKITAVVEHKKTGISRFSFSDGLDLSSLCKIRKKQMSTTNLFLDSWTPISESIITFSSLFALLLFLTSQAYVLLLKFLFLVI